MIQSETFLRVEEKFRLSSAQAEQFLIAARDQLTPDIYPEYDLNTIYYLLRYAGLRSDQSLSESSAVPAEAPPSLLWQSCRWSARVP